MSLPIDRSVDYDPGMNSAESAGTVELTFEGPLAWIRLNRPDRRNAVTDDLVRDLCHALAHTRDTTAVRAVVLTGHGPAFCAGHDLKQPTPEGDSRARLERLQEVTRRLRELPQPVVAAVHGYAIGAGAEFAIGADLVVAADDAVFQFPEAGLGLSVTGAASRLLPLLVGPLKAKELLLLGDRVDASTAERLGLVNTVVAGAELASRARAVAEHLAAQPPEAQALAKRAVDAGVDSTIATTLELEVGHAMITESSPAYAATTRTFQEHH